MESFHQKHPMRADDPSVYIGQTLTSLPKPAAVLDIAKIRRHCSNMLKAIKLLNLDFRAHVKTHKTTQLAELQIGNESPEARFAVSTVAEIEHLLPLLQRLQLADRRVNVLYAVPIPPSQVRRLANLGRQLGPGTIALIVDHPTQLESLRIFQTISGHPPGVFIKVDTGYHRAGLPPHHLNKERLLEKILNLRNAGVVDLIGLYSHSSLSYSNTTTAEAMKSLTKEITGCLDALRANKGLFKELRQLTLSVGATPQVIAVQSIGKADSPECIALMRTIREISNDKIGHCSLSLELHAGVYSVMDLQQLDTHSVEGLGVFDDEVALSVLAEVVSVYNDGERTATEALIAAGTLALGREPCQSYSGWGRAGQEYTKSIANSEMQLIVSRISQEHSILSWEARDRLQLEEVGSTPKIPLDVGQSVRIYPNHACVTGAMYHYYYIVDSDDAHGAETVIDVWTRACGW